MKGPGNAAQGSKKFVRGAVAIGAARFKQLKALSVRFLRDKTEEGVTIDNGG